MWPSIPASKGFGQIACPLGAACELPYCIFEHKSAENIEAIPSKLADHAATSDQEPDLKRRKISYSSQESLPSDSTGPSPKIFVGSILPEEKSSISGTPQPSDTTAGQAKSAIDVKSSSSSSLLCSTPSVTPLSTELEAKPSASCDVLIPLIPRKLYKDPTTFTKRMALLKALYTFMKVHNDKMSKAVKPEIKALHLSPSQLTKLAVDEEEQVAKANPSIYENILKQRLIRLKGMTPESWVKERREAIAKEKGILPKKSSAKKIDTGLSPIEEILFLSRLVCSQTGLDAHGYVTHPPSEAEIAETQRVYKAASGWEECDRCRTRFQVFTDRREEDGALTTGGRCRYHWGKRIFAKKDKNAVVPEPTRLSCCNEAVGSPGCSTHDTHVYNVKDSKRLSLYMRFVETPENDKVQAGTAVCFDCEMGYTTHGLEMLRLTVISWPQHKPLIDVLVRPLGHLLDVNTRFSGVTAEQYVNAKPYDPAQPAPIRNDLRIVDSPYAARDLFLSHISPQTPVMGHALENDLNVIRLIHPTIIDTVLLYPTRQGLPIRHGLRTLAKTHLDQDIQQGGAAGHDSFEDARTTGELIRFKVKKEWATSKEKGWSIGDLGLIPSTAEEELPDPKATAVPLTASVAQMTVLEGNGAAKRKLENDNKAVT